MLQILSKAFSKHFWQRFHPLSENVLILKKHVPYQRRLWSTKTLKFSFVGTDVHENYEEVIFFPILYESGLLTFHHTEWQTQKNLITIQTEHCN